MVGKKSFPETKCSLSIVPGIIPWLVRWPGAIMPGTIDNEHFVSGKDFFPTILDILNLPIPNKLDGFSFKDVLLGKKQAGRKDVYTQFYMTSGYRTFPMRCVQNEQYGYIFNAWSDGDKAFKNESQHGYTWKAMKKYAETDSLVNKRVLLFSNRVVEEFYDFKNDPDALNNLIDDPDYVPEIRKMQELMELSLRESNDPLLNAFLSRYDKDKMQETVNAIQEEAYQRKAIERKRKKKKK
jgi:N-sulfoglucosamine sulfohydrolase